MEHAFAIANYFKRLRRPGSPRRNAPEEAGSYEISSFCDMSRRHGHAVPTVYDRAFRGISRRCGAMRVASRMRRAEARVLHMYSRTLDGDTPMVRACGETDRLSGGLNQAVTGLLGELGDCRAVFCERDDRETRIVVPIRYPDGIGRGQVVARLFAWQGAQRVDIEIVHNRTFARPDGSASARRCFLNDFQASITLALGEERFPDSFRAHVMAGIQAARGAVQGHNRRHAAPWTRIRVAADPYWNASTARSPDAVLVLPESHEAEPVEALRG